MIWLGTHDGNRATGLICPMIITGVDIIGLILDDTSKRKMDAGLVVKAGA